jgi:TolB-like protein
MSQNKAARTNFFTELKRRKVHRVAIYYAAAAWPLIEIAYAFLSAFNAPGWVSQVVLVGYASGFPIALLLAWYYQWTPQGIRADFGYGDQIGPMEFNAGTLSLTSPPAARVAFRETVSDPDPKSIAVLPLENLSPNPDNAYFASGVHEEILDQLAKISEIRTIARMAVLRYQNSQLSPSHIARELNVSWVLEGGVRFSRNNVRITTHLIRAADDMHLWSESYDFELDDIFRIQSDVAKKVAQAMQARLLPSEIKRLDRPATTSPKAYTLFLRHRHQYNQEQSRPTLDDAGWLKSGIVKMKEATGLDPNFARGIAELGWLIWYRGQLSAPDLQTRDFDEAVALAEQALALDPNISRAYQVLHRVYFHRRQWSQWEEYARKSVELPDLDGTAAFNLGLTLALVSHFTESYIWFDIALERNPTLVYYWELAVTNKVSGGAYDQAIDMAEQYLAVGGDKNAYHAVRAYCFYRLGKETSFLAEFNAIDSYTLNSTFHNQFLDFIRTVMGQKDEVLTTLLGLPDDYTKASRIVHCGAASGDLDLIFAAYQAMMDHNGYIHVSEIVDARIRNDERFRAVEDYLQLPKQGEILHFPIPR